MSENPCSRACHNAISPICTCACNGRFHGYKGARTRALVYRVIGYLPTTRREFEAVEFMLKLRATARALEPAPRPMRLLNG